MNFAELDLAADWAQRLLNQQTSSLHIFLYVESRYLTRLSLSDHIINLINNWTQPKT